ncbi:hypothetical protein I6E29_00795 [Arcanobacterium haemolyticum]|nr:hypothetical protein [Arcanobacterium haemolyticum]
MNHESYSWAALTGAWYIPSGEEREAWDRAAAEKRIKGKPRSYRPWLDRHLDPLRPTPSTRIEPGQAAARDRINELFNISE